MELTTENQDGVLIIAIRGEVDLYNTKQLSDKLDEAHNEGVTQVVLEVSRVSYIDSTGIGAMIKGKKIMKSAGGDMKFAGVQESIREVFARTKLDSVFSYYDSVAAAVADF